MDGENEDMLVMQLRQIREMRVVLGLAVEKLNRKMRECSGANEQENCMAELMKLSQMQMKLLPLEQEVQRCHDEAADRKSYRLSEADWKIIERAIARKKRTAKLRRKRKIRQDEGLHEAAGE